MKKLVRSVENLAPVPLKVSGFSDPFYLSPNQKAELFISEISESKPNAVVVSEKAEPNWHERGELPPVGWHGEINFGPYTTWIECVSLPDGFFAILTTDGWSAFDRSRITEPKFRPIRTEREKFIDDATLAMQPNALTGTMALWFGKLFDAGFRGPKVEK